MPAALVEGLPALARIAFTARTARRTQRFFPFRVEPARLVIERAIRAAEKAATGQELSEEEDHAAGKNQERWQKFTKQWGELEAVSISRIFSIQYDQHKYGSC